MPKTPYLSTLTNRKLEAGSRSALGSVPKSNRMFLTLPRISWTFIHNFMSNPIASSTDWTTATHYLPVCCIANIPVTTARPTVLIHCSRECRHPRDHVSPTSMELQLATCHYTTASSSNLPFSCTWSTLVSLLQKLGYCTRAEFVKTTNSGDIA